MTSTQSSIVNAPLDEVFAWHTRPGAITRLTPPWLPVTVAAEAASLRDGRAVLGLPGGLHWDAQHDPRAYDPPRRFADDLASMPLRAGLTWRHVHEFCPVPEGSTQVTDTIITNVPAALLRPVLAYRHRQLSDDLAAHEWARRMGQRPLTIAVTGSSGLVGAALAAFLTSGGHQVIRLVRREPQGPNEREWHPDDPAADLLCGADAVVHLAGTPIGGRFTAEHKRQIRGSRVGPTAKLAQRAATTADGPAVMVAASAIGYYGARRGDEILTETSTRGDGFLADVTADWESACDPARDAGIRVISIRTGIVQSPRGGTLRLLRPVFTAGLGGRLGSGEQWVSWIGIDDLVGIYHRAIFDPVLTGPVNGTAPNPVRNTDYTQVLARVLRRPALLPVPGAAAGLLLGGEGARELAQASQRVKPSRLISAGYHFRHPGLEQALRHLLGRTCNPSEFETDGV